MLAGVVFGIAGGALGFGIGYACVAGRGIDFALNDRQTALLLVGTVGGTALWGGIGVGLGAILRSQRRAGRECSRRRWRQARAWRDR